MTQAHEEIAVRTTLMIAVALTEHHGDVEATDKAVQAAVLEAIRRAVEPALMIIAENGCDCEEDPPEETCLAHRIEAALSGQREEGG